MNRMKLLAFLLVTIMVATVLPVAFVTAQTPSAQTPPTSTVGAVPAQGVSFSGITITPASPVRSQTITITGTLKKPDGQPAANAEIELWYRVDPSNEFVLHKTTTTNSAGAFTLSYSPSTARWIEFMIVHPGSVWYKGTTTYRTVEIGRARISCYADNYDPSPNGRVNIYGYVTDPSNKGVPNAAIMIYMRSYDSATGKWTAWTCPPAWSGLKTATNGYYTVGTSSAKVMQFKAQYLGYSTTSSQPRFSQTSRDIQVDFR